MKKPPSVLTATALVAAVAIAASLAVGPRTDPDAANDRVGAAQREVDENVKREPREDASEARELRDVRQGPGLLAESGVEGGFDDIVNCIGDPGGQGNAPAAEPRTRKGDDTDTIAQRVEDIRGLRFERLPAPRLLSEEAAGRRLLRLFRRGYKAEEARVDGQILAMLGALPDDSDLRAEMENLLRAQVAGFYVPGSGELVVRRGSARLGRMEELTLAHELEHALADQALGLPVDEDREAGGEDAALAALSVVEGDATVVMQRYAARHLSILEQVALALDPSTTESLEQLRRTPHFLRRQLEFPYVAGMAFVCHLYARGGWDAVDRAYERPPHTTAQVLFPERYRAGEEAVDPSDPPLLPGWSRTAVRAIGAAPLGWLLEAPGGDRDRAVAGAAVAVAEWAGGEVTLFERPGRAAVALVLVDRPGGARLCPRVAAWYGAAFPDAERATSRRLTTFDGEQDAAVSCREGEVRVGIAPSPEVAAALAR